MLRKFRNFGQRRFAREVSSEKLYYSPTSSWGYTVTDIGMGLDLLDLVEKEENETAMNQPTEEQLSMVLQDLIHFIPLLNLFFIFLHKFQQKYQPIKEMSGINLKIADGRPSVPGSWAWVAQIKYFRNGRYEFVCAGTLIADRWILTAAQCLSDE